MFKSFVIDLVLIFGLDDPIVIVCLELGVFTLDHVPFLGQVPSGGITIIILTTTIIILAITIIIHTTTIIIIMFSLSTRFLRRRAAKRETADIEAALTVASAASVFKKNALEQNVET